MSNQFEAQEKAIEFLGNDLEVDVLFSQSEVANRLGVSDKTLRNWLPYLRWIYYWKESKLIQNGQFTRDGVIAMAHFQAITRPVVAITNPKTKKFAVDRQGKTKTKRQKPLMAVVDYAAKVWARNGVAANPQPFASEPSSPEVAELLSDQAAQAEEEQESQDYEVVDGELEGENVSTLMVFEARSYADELTQMAEDVTTLVQDGRQSQMNLAKSLLARSARDGELLGTIAAKTEIQNYHTARARVFEEAFAPDTAVVEQVPKQAMKRTTKKV